jgi:hypothetical protein
MRDESNRKKSNPEWIGVAIAIGAGIGTTASVLLSFDIGLGVTLGAGLGVVAGAITDLITKDAQP